MIRMYEMMVCKARANLRPILFRSLFPASVDRVETEEE
jgi:hypothetical protein